jgi:hypothetical protein
LENIFIKVALKKFKRKKKPVIKIVKKK